VRYNDKFYSEVLLSGNFTKLGKCCCCVSEEIILTFPPSINIFSPSPLDFAAYYSTDILVGAICCRLEKEKKGDHDSRLYIMTLGVLAPYRSCGIGTKLLTTTLEEADMDGGIEEVYLHVQTSNTDALDFYKRFGFEQREKICNYYKRIEPPDCYVMVRRRPGPGGKNS